MSNLKIALAQLNFLVGDIEGNAKKIIAESNRILANNPIDLIVFPELALTGYPPEDLLFRPALYERIDLALKKIQVEIKNTAVIIGYPECTNGNIYNKAAVISSGKILAEYSKQKLPNYTVFDEKRYFTEGKDSCVFTLNNTKIGLIICEDTWYPEPIKQAKDHGAELIISINASPFDINQIQEREKIIAQRIKEVNLPILYVNLIGGQDELVFDGGSMVFNADGACCQKAAHFKEEIIIVDFDNKQAIKKLFLIENIYQALLLGTTDYITKNKFKGALIGLSGGIDSALTLAIAVDAIGAENIEAVLMPSQYNLAMSLEDAIAECEILKVKYHIIKIDNLLNLFLKTLHPFFQNKAVDKTEENLQARIRGIILMALSNKSGKIVLTTGNKSEMSVGYATLYGDMAGGLAVLKDVSKTRVYQLAKYRNSLSHVIPERVITRAPSAELAHNQTDQDLLPPYDLLDQLLENYIEKDEDRHIPSEIIKMININEYKRRQAAMGIRITKRSFGKDRRYPVTSGY